MKPNETVLNVESTLQGEEIAMTLDAGATAHLMDVLSKQLYSDAELAVIREYSTNALDSHIEAGITRPIEVQTPTALSPYFKVKDYGIGLDAEDIRTIYSRYGASTKRDSDEVVGMLGLGCKSALAYTDQFTLVGVKNGKSISVSISRAQDGGGTMTVLDAHDTDEPNGVEIIVPVKKYNDLEKKAKHFFSFWKPGTVILNGKAPEVVKGFRIADDLLINPNDNTSYIVMGNVPYPVSSGFAWSDNLNWNFGRVAWVNIGDVNFTPAREALQETAATKQTLQVLKGRFTVERDSAVQRLVDEAKTKPEALKLLGELRSAWSFRNQNVTYKGQMIPSQIEVPQSVKKNDKGVDVTVNDYRMVIANGRTGYGNNNTQKTYNLATSLLESSVWLVGFTGEDLTPYKKKKLIQWQAKQDFKVMPKQYILTPSVPPSALEWINSDTIMSWDDVEAEKIINPYKAAPGASGKLVGTFIGWVDGDYSESIDINDINLKKPVVYIEGTKAQVEALTSRWDTTLSMLDSAAPKGYTLLIVGKNRVTKLKRDIAKVQTVHTFIKAAAEKWAKKLTDDEKRIIRYREDAGFKRLNTLDPTKINDPELSTLIELAKKRSDNLIASYNRLSRYASVDFKGLDSEPKVIKNYPLLTQLGTYGTLDADVKNHLYLYINAVHAAKEEV